MFKNNRFLLAVYLLLFFAVIQLKNIKYYKINIRKKSDFVMKLLKVDKFKQRKRNYAYIFFLPHLWKKNYSDQRSINVLISCCHWQRCCRYSDNNFLFIYYCETSGFNLEGFHHMLEPFRTTCTPNFFLFFCFMPLINGTTISYTPLIKFTPKIPPSPSLQLSYSLLYKFFDFCCFFFLTIS